MLHERSEHRQFGWIGVLDLVDADHQSERPIRLMRNDLSDGIDELISDREFRRVASRRAPIQLEIQRLFLLAPLLTHRSNSTGETLRQRIQCFELIEERMQQRTVARHLVFDGRPLHTLGAFIDLVQQGGLAEPSRSVDHEKRSEIIAVGRERQVCGGQNPSTSGQQWRNRRCAGSERIVRNHPDTLL